MLKCEQNKEFDQLKLFRSYFLPLFKSFPHSIFFYTLPKNTKQNKIKNSTAEESKASCSIKNSTSKVKVKLDPKRGF